MKRWSCLLLCVVSSAGGLAAGLWLSDWLDVDTCLDRGGRWNYDQQDCEYQ